MQYPMYAQNGLYNLKQYDNYQMRLEHWLTWL